MNKYIGLYLFAIIISLALPVNGYAEDGVRVRLYFGLSIPNGKGISLKEWQAFQDKILLKNFEGFNVVDSTGFYKGEPERSKIVTIIIKKGDEKLLTKAKEVAAIFAKKHGQDSVMMVIINAKYEFIKAKL